MNIRDLIKTFIIPFLLISVILFAARAYAETLEISGNGSNSNNSVQLNQTNSTKINQSNSADVNNSVNIDSNTGGNSINGGVGNGSIKTGDITNNVNINNQLNKNIADVKCLNCPTPTPKPTIKPSPTPGKGQGTPTPTSKPGNGGNGGDGGNGGVGGPGAAAPAVMGLAVTSGEDELINLLKLLPALSSLAVGYSFLRKNA